MSSNDLKGQQKGAPGGIGQQLGKAIGAGVSPSGGPSPAGPSAAEQERVSLSERASRLGQRLSDIRSKAMLGDLRSSLDSLDSTLSGMPAALEEARRGGYVYKAYLEKKVEVLRQQWQGLRTRIDTEAAQQGRWLVQQADSIQQRLSAMGSNLNAPTLDSLERDASALESKVQDTARALEGTFSTLRSNALQTNRQIESLRTVLQRVGGATFRLRPAENIVDVVGAQYLTQGDEGPKGFLFLTDQRLLFEQNEKVATKKFLFITTESEQVHKLLFEAPIGGVRPEPSERGALMFKKELLKLSFTGAALSQALLRLEADSETWAALIRRVASGEIESERVGAEMVPAPVQVSTAQIPSNCPTCGAGLTAEIVRGMTSITCEYCGTVIRL